MKTGDVISVNLETGKAFVNGNEINSKMTIDESTYTFNVSTENCPNCVYTTNTQGKEFKTISCEKHRTEKGMHNVFKDEYDLSGVVLNPEDVKDIKFSND